MRSSSLETVWVAAEVQRSPDSVSCWYRALCDIVTLANHDAVVSRFVSHGDNGVCFRKFFR